MAALSTQAIIDDVTKDMAKNSRRAGAAFVRAVQQHPAIPFDTGRLSRGIQLVTATTRPPVKIRVASTATSDRGFDYPAHLNAGGSNGVHTGWFDAATGDAALEAAADELIKGI